MSSYNRNGGKKQKVVGRTIQITKPLMGGGGAGRQGFVGQAGKYGGQAETPELKWIDTLIGNGTLAAPTANTYAKPFVNGGGTAFYLNCMSQGAGPTNRIGNKITMKGLQLKTIIRPNNNTGNLLTAGPYAESALRIVIFYDSQINGAVTTVADLLQSTSGDATPVNNIPANLPYALVNPNNRDRFIILRDELLCSPYFVIDATSAGLITFMAQADQENWTNVYSPYIKLKKLVTVFKMSSMTAAVTDQATGGLGMFLIADAGNGATNTWVMFGTSRLRYWDV